MDTPSETFVYGYSCGSRYHGIGWLLAVLVKAGFGKRTFVYVEDKEAAAVQCAGLKDRYSHVYVISGEPESGAVADSGMDTVYHKDNKIQMDVKMPEELDGIAAWIPYAQEFVSSIQPVAVYEYISE